MMIQKQKENFCYPIIPIFEDDQTQTSMNIENIAISEVQQDYKKTNVIYELILKC